MTKPKKPKKKPVSRQLRWMRANMAAGLCKLCRDPVWRPGADLCALHRAADRARRRRKTAERRAARGTVDPPAASGG